MPSSDVVFVDNSGRVEQNQCMISHSKVLIHGIKIVFIALSNVLGERIRHAKAISDQFGGCRRSRDFFLPNIRVPRNVSSLHSWLKWKELLKMLGINRESIL
jgi:hypothetical protein